MPGIEKLKRNPACLHTIIRLLIASIFLPANIYGQNPVDTNWDKLPVILTRIHAPVFPGGDINIVDLGAPTNGIALSTSFIQKAIDSCNALGGGRVIIPAGSFLTGAITLKSNTNLYVAPGATL